MDLSTPPIKRTPSPSSPSYDPFVTQHHTIDTSSTQTHAHARDSDDDDNEQQQDKQHHVSLSNLGLPSIPAVVSEEFSDRAQSLDLSHNNIESAKPLESFSMLKTLDLSYNNIHNHLDLPDSSALHLTSLSLAHNLIGDSHTTLVELIDGDLDRLVALEQLDLTGNPCFLPEYWIDPPRCFAMLRYCIHIAICIRTTTPTTTARTTTTIINAMHY
jgi:Leucine-rich repeat (LRR) protein